MIDPLFLRLVPSHWVSPIVCCLIVLCLAVLTRQKYLVIGHERVY